MADTSFYVRAMDALDLIDKARDEIEGYSSQIDHELRNLYDEVESLEEEYHLDDIEERTQNHVKWTLVNESLPEIPEGKPAVRVLVYYGWSFRKIGVAVFYRWKDDDGTVVVEWGFGDGIVADLGYTAKELNITHWAYLPEIPEEELLKGGDR